MRPAGLMRAFMAPGVVVLVFFFIVPLGAVLRESLTAGAYSTVLNDPIFWNSLKGSLVLGTFAPLVSVAVGSMVSLHLARLGDAQRTALLFVISLPLTFSGLIVAYGFILVFGRAGFVTLTLSEFGADPALISRFIYSPLGLGVAYAYYLIPRVVMIVLPVIQNFDHVQIVAARISGASIVRAHFDVMLPQILPGLIAAFCLTSAVAIGAYGTALALVGTQISILPIMLFSKISETGSDFPAAAALSVLLMGICCTVIGIAEALGHRNTGTR